MAIAIDSLIAQQQMDITLDLQRDGKRRSRASSAASIRGEARYQQQQQDEELHLHSYGDFQPHSNSRRRRRRGQRRLWPFEEHVDEDGNDDDDDDDDDDDGHRHALEHDNYDEVCLHDPLNPSVWNCLPSELLERILACLPMASLFKFRAVCRAWNTVPFQPVFKSLRALSMTPESWLIMLAAPPQESSDPLSNWSFAFTLEDNKAVPLPLSFLPFPPDPGCFSYCSSAGGLFCYHYHMGFAGEFESNSIWVGNPFTRDWKCLPPMIGSFPLNFPIRGLAGMAVLDSAHGETQPRPVHYKIIVRTGSERTWGSAMMTEEYDSRTNEWRVTTMENVPLDHRIEQVVYCKGTLYFLTWQARDGIYAYHLEKEEWTRILPPKRYQFTSPHMVECCGHLVLVGGVGRHHTTRCRGTRRHHIRTIGIKLWQLVEDSLASPPAAATDAEPFFGGMHASSWSWLSSMPEDLVQEFVTGVHFHCTSIHNLIYLTNNTNMLIFDAVTRLWRRLIISQLPFSVQDFVSFVPKLEASP